MEHHQAHPFKHTLLHPRDRCVVDLLVRSMAPINQDIRVHQKIVPEPLILIFQRRGANINTLKGAQRGRERFVDTERVDSRHGGVLPFVHKLVPDRDADQANKSTI